jgi:hypothetical protein
MKDCIFIDSRIFNNYLHNAHDRFILAESEVQKKCKISLKVMRNSDSHNSGAHFLVEMSK